VSIKFIIIQLNFSFKNFLIRGIKKIPLLNPGGDKEEAKMLTQNTKSAFRKQKPPKNFSI
jgi:hypothetical protein